jgi:branched-chain amino acid transport system substrate-binding protein
MEFRYCLRLALLGLSLAMVPGAALAQNGLKLGMVGEFFGPFAQYGQQILGGMKAYMKVKGDTVAGKKIEIIQKETTGPSPDVAKRLAQELVTRDNVDVLAYGP